MSNELALNEFAFVLAGMSFYCMSADGAGFDTLAGTNVGFVFMGAAVVGTDLFGAFYGETVVMRAGVWNIGANDGVIGTNMNLADASFEASAFYEGGSFAFLGFGPWAFAPVEPVLFDEAFFGEVDGENGGFMGDAGDGTVDIITDADEVVEISLHGV